MINISSYLICKIGYEKSGKDKMFCVFLLLVYNLEIPKNVYLIQYLDGNFLTQKKNY